MALSEKVQLLGAGLYKDIPDEITILSIPTASELDYVGGEDFDSTMLDKIFPKAIEENLGEQKTKIFTYPYGLYGEGQSEALEKEGYIINLTDNKINKSKDLNLYGLHRCYPLSDSVFKIKLKIMYRSIRY